MRDIIFKRKLLSVSKICSRSMCFMNDKMRRNRVFEFIRFGSFVFLSK